MRFAAAQLLAYVEDGLYLRNARQANGIAARIAAGLRDLSGVTLLAPVEANEIFLQLPAAVMDGMEADGVRFFRRPGNIARFVCRFDATPGEADALLASLRRHLDAKGSLS
jgi:threonine aldolase